MILRILSILTAGMLALILWSGCSSPSAVSVPKETRMVTDAAGRSVALPVGPPKRIVTLSPEVTELVFWLGAGDRVAGVSRFSNFPPKTAGLPKVGGYTDFNVEAIAALRPDLVIGTMRGNPKDLVRSLEAASIPVYVLHAAGFDDIPDVLRKLAGILNAPGPGLDTQKNAIDAFEQQTRNVVAATRTRIAAAGFAHARCVVMLQYEPPIVAGADTLLEGLLKAAGLVNIGGELGGRYPLVSAEALAALKPRVLVAVGMNDDGIPLAQRVARLRVGSPVVCELDPDTATRATPRFLTSLQTLGDCLEAASGASP